jgi:hypothetical protein
VPGSGQISVETGRVPTPNLAIPAIALSPASGGVALSTKFTVTAQGWTDTALPLSFAYAFVNSAPLNPIHSGLGFLLLLALRQFLAWCPSDLAGFRGVLAARGARTVIRDKGTAVDASTLLPIDAALLQASLSVVLSL